MVTREEGMLGNRSKRRKRGDYFKNLVCLAGGPESLALKCVIVSSLISFWRNPRK